MRPDGEKRKATFTDADGNETVLVEAGSHGSAYSACARFAKGQQKAAS